MANVPEGMYVWCIINFGLSAPIVLGILSYQLYFCLGIARRIVWHRQLERIWRRNHLASPLFVPDSFHTTAPSSPSTELVSSTAMRSAANDADKDGTKILRPRPGLRNERLYTQSGRTGILEVLF
jgi:hypothetical protein